MIFLRSSQVELASSVTTSSEALPHVGSTGQLTGSAGHLRGSGGQLSAVSAGRLAVTMSAPHLPPESEDVKSSHRQRVSSLRHSGGVRTSESGMGRRRGM